MGEDQKVTSKTDVQACQKDRESSINAGSKPDDQVSIEMVDQATCRPEMWSAVEREGIDL